MNQTKQQYEAGIIKAYNTLTTAVDVWVSDFGGDNDNRALLIAERDARLQSLSTGVVDTVQILGDITLRSDGTWTGNGYTEAQDDHGYQHIIATAALPVSYPSDWVNRKYKWVDRNFLSSFTTIKNICGYYRNTIHHIDHNKSDDCVHNLICIPNEMHRLFHPENTQTICHPGTLWYAVNERLKEQDQLPVTIHNAERVDARWLHGELGLSKDFSNWIRQWTPTVQFLLNLQGEQKSGSGGHNRKDYSLSVQDALTVAIRTDTPQAEAVRKILINKLVVAHHLAQTIIHRQPPTALEMARQNVRLLEELEAKNRTLSELETIVGDGGYISKKAVRAWRNQRNVQAFEVR